MKEFKIRRYDHARTQKRKRTAITTGVMVLLVAVALVVGWFSFEPVARFVTQFQFPQLLPSPAPSQSQSAPAPLPGSSQTEPAPTQPQAPASGFPERSAYLPPVGMSTPAALEKSLADFKLAGITGVVFDLKDADGVVQYQSALEQVALNRAQSPAAYDLKTTVAAIRKAGMTPIGRIYAFRDKTATAHLSDSAVKYLNTKVNWIDNSKASGGKSWLNPNNHEAQEYVLSLVEETAHMGLETVMLDGVQFPEGYALNLATYGNVGPLDKSAVLADFLTRASARGSSAGCRVYPTISLIAATGLSNVRYGEDVSTLLAACGGGVVEVMPEQFGNGVTSEKLTLSAPALNPGATVTQALAAAPILDNPAWQLVAMVQAYTSTTLPPAGNKLYGVAEVQEQMAAATQAGIPHLLLYNPDGLYSPELK